MERVLNDFLLEGHEHVEVFLLDERLWNVFRHDSPGLAQVCNDVRQVELENGLDFKR
jgi:hypothetical protein